MLIEASKIKLPSCLTLFLEGLQQHRIHTVNPTGPVGVHGVVRKGDYLVEVYIILTISGEASPTIWSCYANFSVCYRPYKESISKEMNNDNDLNLHSMTKLSGWLRYC